MMGGKIMSRSINKKYPTVELKFLEIGRKMPPLYHKLPNEEFDIEKSEVVQWLIQQPETKQFIYDRIMNRSKALKPIEYDSHTGKWKGVDYEEIIHDGSFSNCAVCDNHTCEDGYCSWDE